MDYTPSPHALLEALAYLGGRANGHSVYTLRERLQAKSIAVPEEFDQAAGPVLELTRRLDKALAFPEETLQRLFANLPGFSYNTIGSYSPAFLLLYPMLWDCDGGLDCLRAGIEGMTHEQAAWQVLTTLELCEKQWEPEEDGLGRFADAVLSLNVPADSRLALFGTVRGCGDILTEAAQCLAQVVEAMARERALVEEICANFGQALQTVGCREYMRNTSSLDMSEEVRYHLRPFLFGPDTNLSLNQSRPEEVSICCGVLRGMLMQLLSTAGDEESRVFETIRLLGDKTRFDILCALCHKPAYGQELSEKFGLARNTIHHHMSKLLAAGLVSCTVEGNKVYYAPDRERIDQMLAQERSLLLGE